MSHRPSKITIGEKVSLEKIESAFRQYWRDLVETGSEEAVLKASTLNLIILVDRKTVFEELLSDIHEIVSHHPGRMIVAFIDPDVDSDEIDAHVSAYSQKSKEGKIQISAQVVVLKTGRAGSIHLAGALLPLLLADLPVYLWCTCTQVLAEPDFGILLNYADRLIVRTANEYTSTEEMANSIKQILAYNQKCKISDITWSELTDWREAIAQFFDTKNNQHYLGTLEEIEITFSGDKLSNHAFLLAGWLSSQLKNVPNSPDIQNASTIYFKRQRDKLSIKIHRIKLEGVKGLYKIKLIAKENGRTVILNATKQQDNFIETTIQKGGTLQQPNYVAAAPKSSAIMLCNELDFLQQDIIYVHACEQILEFTNEN
ncbi:hypothetical protein EH223_02985 [candidate division KSB1 bacterium]|nr:glucose-6-phosphate dehydrogenase assembly protein OpcA [candidate division KSB1 bacterium]RQW06106.1 MAG: hypothetical protein EH223_02985 [candidate division KSB1 bacterium]